MFAHSPKWEKKKFPNRVLGKTYLRVKIKFNRVCVTQFRTYASNCIKFASSGVLLPASLLTRRDGDELTGGAGSSSGFGCIKINGNSATKSLIKTVFKFFTVLYNFPTTYPPNAPKHNFTLTLY